jgi:hypothetical protein
MAKKKESFWDKVITGVTIGVIQFFVISAIVSGTMFVFFKSTFKDVVAKGKKAVEQVLACRH